MREYRYLILGGGMTADAAVRGIRKNDSEGSIGVISSEAHPPYARPPLSKGLWKGDALESIWRGTEDAGADLLLSKTATSIDAKNRRVLDADGDMYGCEKLLIATGGRVRRFSWDNDLGIVYFRTLDDYRTLEERSGRGEVFAVIGGGFIGSEIAAALAMKRNGVLMMFPEHGIGARLFPRPLSLFLNDYYRERGVEVLAESGVGDIRRTGAGYRITTTAGAEYDVDCVVAGLGIQPNQEIAQAAGLSVGDGILVDAQLRTSEAEVFAAGDVANVLQPGLARRMRIEHEDAALAMGELAGRNMAGERATYSHQSFFYSDLFDLGYEAVGEFDSRAEIIEDWKEEFREGVVYSVVKGRVRGVLLWNTWGQVDAARALISDAGSFSARDLIGRLPA